MKKPVILYLLLALWLLVGGTVGFIGPVLAAQEQAREKLPLRELRTFAEVFGRIKSDYVEGVDDKELLESAIRGMLSGLDPHSSYLDKEEYRELQVGTSGEFGGVGIEVGMEDGFVKVIAPIDDTPAERAGLKAGDLIIRIDDEPVKGISLNDAVNVMRGKPGTQIELTILREGADRPFNVKLVRDVIHVDSVKNRTLEPGYGYVRVSHFQSRTTEDLLAALSELKEENDDKLKGLVLDLRNNPGGVLNSAVGVSDAFLGGGLIVYTKGRVDDSELQFKAGPDDVLDGAPIVVLVNGGSASASEIVAGALQDHNRAIIMGRPTFGKGSVQTIVPIDDSTALKLTTARYYTPSGRSIQAQGIEPDIELASGELNLVDNSSIEPLKEADLRRHLDDAEGTEEEGADTDTALDETPEDGEREDKDKDKDKDADEKKPKGEKQDDKEGAEEGDRDGGDKSADDGEDKKDKSPLAARDYELSEALNVLKGLNILGRRNDD